MERAALRRLPRFIREYVAFGIGKGGGMARNRAALDAVRLMPRYLGEPVVPDPSVRLLGRDWSAPFGVAPVGLGTMVRPGAAIALAKAAARQGVPFAVSTFAMESLERLAKAGGASAWFQLYMPADRAVEADMVRRARDAGYEVMVVTVDIPAATRRDHDIRNGLGVPPRLGAAMLADLALHPHWAIERLLAGWPEFGTFAPYAPRGMKAARRLEHASGMMVVGQAGVSSIARLRALWPGKLVVKGILDAGEARLCREAGADGVIVSNHGGRQLEAAPAAPEVLPAIRAAVGPDFALIADGGVMGGLDVLRMLALGADMVMAGRAFYYAVAAMGAEGAGHAMAVMDAEIRCAMGQIGVARPSELAARLVP